LWHDAEPVVRCEGSDEIKILTHIQTNIHREFAKVAATLLMAKATFFLIFHGSFERQPN
jgi:hypothetical protein